MRSILNGRLRRCNSGFANRLADDAFSRQH
jgi:hypothetical protein